MSYSTLGRPRKLTDEQVRAILFWQRLPRGARPKSRDFAQSLGVSTATIWHCLSIGGRYKKAEAK